MEYPITINYQYTNNLYKTKQWLDGLPNLIACDFEVASKFPKYRKDLFKFKLDNYDIKPEERRLLLQQYSSNGLSHPSLTVITHFSVAWSDRDSYVIICDSSNIRKLVFQFLISTSKMQLWHNAIFDFKHINANTSSLPKHYIDTMLLGKSLLNDANSMRDKVGLKDLMGYKYGAWGLVNDENTYTLENIWNLDMIKYAATDSPATYCLYKDIQETLTNPKWRI